MLHYSLVDQLNWLTLILLPVDVLHTSEDALPRDEVLELCDDLVVDAAVVDDRAQLLDDVDIVVLLDLGLRQLKILCDDMLTEVVHLVDVFTLQLALAAVKIKEAQQIIDSAFSIEVVGKQLLVALGLDVIGIPSHDFLLLSFDALDEISFHRFKHLGLLFLISDNLELFHDLLLLPRHMFVHVHVDVVEFVATFAFLHGRIAKLLKLLDQVIFLLLASVTLQLQTILVKPLVDVVHAADRVLAGEVAVEL